MWGIYMGDVNMPGVCKTGCKEQEVEENSYIWDDRCPGVVRVREKGRKKRH